MGKMRRNAPVCRLHACVCTARMTCPLTFVGFDTPIHFRQSLHRGPIEVCSSQVCTCREMHESTSWHLAAAADPATCVCLHWSPVLRQSRSKLITHLSLHDFQRVFKIFNVQVLLGPIISKLQQFLFILSRRQWQGLTYLSSLG